VTCRKLLLSPNGTRIAAGGTGDDTMWLRVFDRRAWRRLWRLPDTAMSGVFDFAWLDVDYLLLACGVSSLDPEHSRRGLYKVDLRSGRITSWHFAGRCECSRIERGSGGRTFAVQFVGAVGPLGSLDEVVLIDPRTHATRTPWSGAPAALGSFSPDGQRLLLLVQRRREEDQRGDVVVLNVANRSHRTIAHDALEAAWLRGPQLARASGTGASTSRAISPVARR
jgi:hypothetical protein